ncbi:MAG: ATP-binding cassette domain-containing protein [Nitrospirae bacterium]|nr:ATP-binding cassette domain-containing protein [Nitrospirota bacterium]
MDIIEVINLKKYFACNQSFWGVKRWLKAVDDISFSVKKGGVFSIVGESGSGKSTVARLLLRLITPTSGKILFKGKDIQFFKGDSLKEFRKSIQIIFQDPFASLNPRMTVYDSISEPLKIHRIVHKMEIKNKVVEILNKVGLQADILNRYPHEFSGGQRQRICIARALAISPEIIVADEPLSALDVSIQAQILNILQELQKNSGISFVFISHDLRVVKYFSDEVAVMYLGKIVEKAKTEDIFNKPLHPYTIELLSSIPVIEKHKDKNFQKYNEKLKVEYEAPDIFNETSGCVYSARCNKKIEICNTIQPELKKIEERMISCHLF